jgi:ABC-2 type transport system ATP-binding protein
METRDGIVIDKLTKTYRRRALFGLLARGPQSSVNALDELSLEIRRGEALGVIGPNGAGKTTLMGCLLGLIFPNQGSVLIDGRSPNVVEVRRKIGYLPERLNFDRWMTGYQFMQYHHELAQRPAADRNKDIQSLLSKVELDPKSWGLTIAKYSRGMLQRLGLAQALVGQPQFLFLDEPASGIDPHGVLTVRQVLTDIKKEGITIVLNSHQLDQVEKVCDRVAFIQSGKVEAIESLVKSADLPRTLILHFAAGESFPSSEELNALSQVPEIKFLGLSETSAKFELANDLAAVSLLRQIALKQLPLIEASREQARLEKFFLDNRE